MCLILNPFKPAGIYSSYRFRSKYVRNIGINQICMNRFSSLFCITLCFFSVDDCESFDVKLEFFHSHLMNNLAAITPVQHSNSSRQQKYDRSQSLHIEFKKRYTCFFKKKIHVCLQKLIFY